VAADLYDWEGVSMSPSQWLCLAALHCCVLLPDAFSLASRMCLRTHHKGLVIHPTLAFKEHCQYWSWLTISSYGEAR